MDPKSKSDIMNEVLKILKDDPKAADLSWSLFIAACDDYKYDSVLRPFPKFYLDGKHYKLIDDLRDTVATSGSIAEIKTKLEEGIISEKLLKLLHWTLVEKTTFKLHHLSKSMMSKVTKELGGMSPEPSHIFEVALTTASSERCGALANRLGSHLAFHGSRVENYYSILHHGLQQSLNKVAVFGPGIYLSKELSVSLIFSPTGLTWNGSMFGETISVIAVCEVVNHPDVKLHTDKNKSSIPRKYVLVQNSDLVRLRYLLIYTSPSALRSVPKFEIVNYLKKRSTGYFILAFVCLLVVPMILRKL